MPTLGEQLEVDEAPQLTLHINMSVALRLLADIVSLARLHTNKPTGKRGLTPTPGLFRHHPCPYDQNQEPKERVHLHL